MSPACWLRQQRKCISRRTDGSVAMIEHAVVIAGCGPTGMMLAGERPFARGR